MPKGFSGMTPPAHVFTYGSLMFPAVWERVVQGRYRSLPARLDDHARFEIVNETYPGMVARAGESVAGVLYFDLAPADLAALDAFEGGEYRRERVRVRLENGDAVDAATYIYLLPQNLSESPWLPENFRLARFLDTYCHDKAPK